MRFTVTAVLALFASSASAGLIARQFPSCADDCVMGDNVNYGGCSSTYTGNREAPRSTAFVTALELARKKEADVQLQFAGLGSRESLSAPVNGTVKETKAVEITTEPASTINAPNSTLGLANAKHLSMHPYFLTIPLCREHDRRPVSYCGLCLRVAPVYEPSLVAAHLSAAAQHEHIISIVENDDKDSFPNVSPADTLDWVPAVHPCPSTCEPMSPVEDDGEDDDDAEVTIGEDGEKQHPLPATLRSTIPPTFALCEQAFSAHQRQLKEILVPPMKNLVRKIVIECQTPGMTSGPWRGGEDPAIRAAKMSMEDVLRELRNEEGIWLNGFDWVQRCQNERERQRQQRNLNGNGKEQLTATIRILQLRVLDLRLEIPSINVDAQAQQASHRNQQAQKIVVPSQAVALPPPPPPPPSTIQRQAQTQRPLSLEMDGVEVIDVDAEGEGAEEEEEGEDEVHVVREEKEEEEEEEVSDGQPPFDFDDLESITSADIEVVGDDEEDPDPDADADADADAQDEEVVEIRNPHNIDKLSSLTLRNALRCVRPSRPCLPLPPPPPLRPSKATHKLLLTTANSWNRDMCSKVDKNRDKMAVR
ncbi:hypothetical protein H0H93_011641 [Arthromyces matolae]|nr:hypothetical protein H0H93_011641 [Arthromyces matolae]